LKIEESSLYRQPMNSSQWWEVTEILKTGLALLDQQLAQSIAGQIREALQWLDPVMTEYCASTCPSCNDPCCHAQAIFFNRTDLLSLIASGTSLPPGQTRVSPLAPCRYLQPTGCDLPRIARPYVCVWYLCEAQMDLFGEERAATQRLFVMHLEKIRRNRLRLESLYESHFAPGLRSS
jgi:hypothetical protein